MTKKLQTTLAAMLVLSTMSGIAQTKAATKKAPAESATQTQIRELREQMAAQQAEIDELKAQNASKDAKLATAEQDAQSANAAAAAAAAQAQSAGSAVQENKDSVTKLNSTVTDLQNANAGLAQTISDTKKDLTEKIESPLTLHYKGITITPVAFFALEGVYRSRSINSDINTPFNSTPYPGAAQAHTSELNFSGRQSRIGGLFTGDVGKFKLSGYLEADFLSSGTTSNDNQSNSYTLRQRQFWGQAATGGFKVTGGQMWSLVTETKKSTDNTTENLPMTVDPQYHVGFSWARQPAIRLQQQFGMFTAAVSVEQAQIIYSATVANSNFFIGGLGTGGGLYNLTTNYSNNIAPDVFVKFTADPKVGHFEIGGLARWFRDRYYPNQTLATPSAAGGKNDTKTGGGFFANARFPVTHFLDIGLHVLGGTGVGRYGTSTLPDTTVHPDGTLAPIKGYQGLFSIETHPAKKLDIFGYAGGEYAQRTVYLDTLVGTSNFGKLIGYAPVTSSNAGCNTETLPTSTGNGLAGAAPYNPGTPANCTGATRAVIAGTAGFTYRVYASPKFGRLQYQGVYTYLTREGWNGVTSAAGAATTTYGAPKATNGMVFMGMRYYIP